MGTQSTWGLIFLTLLNMQQQNAKEKAHELRGQNDTDLVTKLNNLRSELVKLRTSKVSSGPQVKLARIRVVRKSIAKVLTVINEKRRNAAKDEWKKKKYNPYDLRARRSKHARRQLTKHERNAQTARAAKKAGNFRQRKFAVTA